MKHNWWQWLLVPFTAATYIATIFIAIIYKPSYIRYYKGCFELIDNTPNSRRTTIWGRPGAQSMGIRMIWFNTSVGLNNTSLRVHERIHTRHGEIVNAAAHAVLVPLSLLMGGGWWLIAAVALGQAAFGISYGAHFLFEWSKVGFKMSRWQEAYLRIWTERIAYRVQDEFELGKHPDAWGV